MYLCQRPQHADKLLPPHGSGGGTPSLVSVCTTAAWQATARAGGDRLVRDYPAVPPSKLRRRVQRRRAEDTLQSTAWQRILTAPQRTEQPRRPSLRAQIMENAGDWPACCAGGGRVFASSEIVRVA